MLEVLFKEGTLCLPHDAISLSYIMRHYVFNVMHLVVLLMMKSTYLAVSKTLLTCSSGFLC